LPFFSDKTLTIRHNETTNDKTLTIRHDETTNNKKTTTFVTSSSKTINDMLNSNKIKEKKITHAKPGDRVAVISGTYASKQRFATFVSWPPTSKFMVKKSMHVRFDDGSSACLRISSVRLIVASDSPSNESAVSSNATSYDNISDDKIVLLNQLPSLFEEVKSLREEVKFLITLLKKNQVVSTEF
jgi:hypothetical protein